VWRLRAPQLDCEPHDLRHHHASVLLAEGVDPADVAERLGHDVMTLLETDSQVLQKDDDRFARSWTPASAVLLRTG
jgi:site-specific recombinase XerD